MLIFLNFLIFFLPMAAADFNLVSSILDVVKKYKKSCLLENKVLKVI